MGRLRAFIVGLVLGCLIVGCAGATFSYRYYEMQEVRFDQGKLLGPTADKDIPFSDCTPTDADKNPCLVMFTKEFLALKQDYLDTKNKLNSCESQTQGRSGD